MLIAIPAHLRPGQMVDGWRVVKPLGSGSFGAVYLVEKDGQRFALKMAMHRASSGDVEQSDARLLREMVCLIQVSGHPNIVRTHAYGRWNDATRGWLYVVLDYVEGSTLGEWLEKTHPTAHEVVGVFVKLASALAHVHGRGVFHRDLKLSNILVRASDGEPFLLDFGVGSYAHAPELTETPLPPGTRRYRSPEATKFLREHGEENEARYAFKATDDVYALGICLYDLLTIPRPVSEAPAMFLGGRLTPPAPHTLNPRVPPGLSAAVLHFVAREPERRAPTAEVMRRELAALLPEAGAAWTEPFHAPAPHLQLAPANAPQQPEASSREVPERLRLRRARGVALVAALAVALVGGMLLRPARVEPPTPPGQEPVMTSPARDPGPDAREPLGPPASAAIAPEVTSPVSAPVQKESPPVKRAPAPLSPPPSTTARKPQALVSPPRWPPAAWTGFLKTCAGVSAVAALQMGCPGAQVRPEPADCPSKARKMMFSDTDEGGLGLRPGVHGFFWINLDHRQPGSAGTSVHRDGPVTGLVRKSAYEGLPVGTLLSGYLWTGGEGIVGRYTEARLPNGRTVPVCIETGDDGDILKLDGSKPGAAVSNLSVGAYAVERWH